MHMGQFGFFDLGDRYAGLDKFGDPLVLLKQTIPWEAFRPELMVLWRTPNEKRKSNAGRKSWDEVLMFRVLAWEKLTASRKREKGPMSRTSPSICTSSRT